MLAQDYFGEKLFFFAAGIIVGVPTAVFFEAVSHLWFTFFGVATLVAPLVEEFCKACTLFYRYERPGKILMRNGFLAGIGFGVAEFVVYVQAGVPFLLRLPAIGFHGAGTAIVAYGIYKRKTVKYFFLAVVLHFTNNLFAAMGLLWFIGGLGATVASYLLAWTFYKRTKESVAPTTPLPNRFCTTCGSLLTMEERYCYNCGSRQSSADEK
ncbi:MAG: hypothetical protein ABSF63_10725 [Candidatus Bathyarchaeia archaeon]|jgi:RsiW-degrading membrane proteinase PrsW (M82 family)